MTAVREEALLQVRRGNVLKLSVKLQKIQGYSK